MQKKFLLSVLSLVVLLTGVFAFWHPVARAQSDGTLNTLDQWKSDGTNITQRTASKPLKLTGLENKSCLGTNSSGIVGLGTCGSGGSSFAYPFPSNATSTSIAFNGGLTGILTGSLVGNASTATALQANGTNCTLQASTGVDASGNAEGCFSVSTFAYPFPSNATSTALTFNAAFTVLNPSTSQGAGTYLGTDATHGIKVGYYNANNYALWAGGVTPGATNYGFLLSNNGTSAQFNATDNVEFNISDATKLTIDNTGAVTLASLTNGLVKSTSGKLSNAANGTDYTLITAKTCTGSDFVNSVTAAGVFGCATPTGGSSSGGLATSSTSWSGSGVAYRISDAAVATAATGTVSGSNGITATAGQSIIGSGLTITGVNALADGSTKGVSAYTANDFDSASGVISIDYTNGQAAASGVKGFLTAADWATFNGKQVAGNYLTALTGDATASGPGSAAITFATVNANTGSFGGSTAIPNFTVNGKGLITAAGTSVVIAPAGTLSGATLNSGVTASSLTSVGTLTALTVSGNTVLANATTTNLFSGRETANTAAFGGTASTTISSTGALTTPSATIGSGSGLAILTSGAVSSIAGTTCTNQFLRAFTSSGGTCATVANTDLANSTISGVALGGSLFAHTHDSTLSGTSYNGSAAVSDWGINLSNANAWTGLQRFQANASTTQLSVYTKAYFGATATTTIDSIGSITTPANSILTLGTTTSGTLKTSSTGVVYADTSSGGALATTTNIGDLPAWTIGKNVRVFTSTGTSTYAVPLGVTKVIVQVVGAGGGSDLVGGAAGGYCYKVVDVTGTTSIQVFVGSGGILGTGSPGPAQGGTGGWSTFGTNGFYCSASGGQGGSTGTSIASGGTGTGGDINIQGGYGDIQITTTAVKGGNGGDSPMGFGLGGVGPKSTSPTPGTGYGSGASGINGGNSGGANGQPGIVVVTY